MKALVFHVQRIAAACAAGSTHRVNARRLEFVNRHSSRGRKCLGHVRIAELSSRLPFADAQGRSCIFDTRTGKESLEKALLSSGDSVRSGHIRTFRDYRLCGSCDILFRKLALEGPSGFDECGHVVEVRFNCIKKRPPR
jgi:hypothetical protein